MAEANCMNCGDSFEPEHSRSDHVCDFCNPPKQPIDENVDLLECSDCGAEFYPTESEHQFTCSDCANNPYL